MAKTLKIGERIRYPITIQKLFKRTGEDVVKREPVLQYSFDFKRKVGDPNLDEEHEINETGIADWDSPAEGKVKQWRVKEGQVVEKDQDLVVIEETCSHEVQYAGLCAICGKDMKEQNWATESLDTERATVAMVHDNVALTVSQSQAERAEMHLQRRLLKDRKLSLVVDLDQTIIHACIEPTVGEWQRDPSNPNYEAVKAVRSFQLDDGPRGLTSGCWYYIKMRPGLTEFLEKVTQMFELHVYTMGTRAYALNIAKIVDPTQKLFGNRVISRDENGSMTAKSLQRLFPVSTNMVVVIDDRADVWPRNRSNLIKVTPYDFFKGIGDINSFFLPKRDDIIAAPAVPEQVKVNGKNGQNNAPSAAKGDSASGHEKAVQNGEDENALLQLQAEEQERTLEKQLKDRPLLHLQEELDREDEEAERSSSIGSTETPAPSTNGESSTPSHQRHNLLRDDDRELSYLVEHLTNLHRSFFDQYAARAARRRTPEDIVADTIPDVGSTLNFLKSQVLKNTNIVLSGLVPLGIDVQNSEIGIQAESFGADISTKVTEDVTHLVISSSRPRTQKVRQAARIPSIKIVNQNWLADSLAQWKKLDEAPYLIQIHPADRSSNTPLEEGAKSRSPPTRPTITIGDQTGRQVIENGHDDDEAENGDADESGDDEEEDGEDEEEGGEEEDDEDGQVLDKYNVMPELQDGEHSPVDNMNKDVWGGIDEELAEFMGSDVDSDSDLGSTMGTGLDTDTEEPSPEKNKKRKYGDGTDNDDAESVLAKKQRLAKSRTTGLRNVENAREESSNGAGLPTPMGTVEEEDVLAGSASTAVANGINGDDDDDDGFADLEAELEAELEAVGQG